MRKLSKEMTDLIQSYSGFYLNEVHQQHTEYFLECRMRELGIKEQKDYFDLVKKDKQEFTQLINNTTINETYFFRESLHFDFLKDSYLPEFRNKKLRIWCAACSTGEEPLSILTLTDMFNIDTDLYATDIDTSALRKFHKGTYGSISFRNDGKQYHHMLEKYKDKESEEFKIQDEVISRIKIRQFNLNEIETAPFLPESLDLIVIRNVMIYFPEELRQKLLKEFYTLLKPDGIVLLSINEIPSVSAPDLFNKNRSGKTYFLQKKKINNKSDIINPSSETRVIKHHTKSRPSIHEQEETRQTRMEIPQKAEKTAKPRENEMTIEELFKYILSSLDDEKLAICRQVIQDYPFHAHNREFQLYLESILFIREKKYAEACDCVTKAVYLDKELWPAQFIMGMMNLRLNNTDKAKEIFSECINNIKNYVNCKKTCYNFMVDTFSPDYFISLCESYIK